MDSLLPFAFICLTSFFTLTNPLGTMPVFLSMTKGIDNEQRARIVKRATIVSFVILISFTVCGQVLFSLFGISTNGFRIAAGFIIMKIGFDMLQAKYSHTKLKDDEVKVYANDISITPLSIWHHNSPLPALMMSTIIGFRPPTKHSTAITISISPIRRIMTLLPVSPSIGTSRVDARSMRYVSRYMMAMLHWL